MLVRVTGRAGVKIYDSLVNEWYGDEAVEKAKEAYVNDYGEEPDELVNMFSFDVCGNGELQKWARTGEPLS